MDTWLDSGPRQRVDYAQEAETYDLLYDGFDDDVAYWRRLAEGDGPLLEVGAGTGRLTAILASGGRRVIGIEPSSAMRERAAERLKDLPEVSVVDGVAQQLPFDDGSFTTVAAPFSVWGFLLTPKDQLAAIDETFRVLAPGGRIHAAVNYYPHGNPHASGRVFQHWWDHRPSGDGGHLFFGGEAKLNADWNVCEYIQTIDRVGDDGTLRRWVMHADVHLFTPFEIMWLLLAGGFHDIALYGDYEKGPATAGSSVLVVEAVR